MRLAGVFVPSMAVGDVTAEAVFSIEIWDRSLGSRTWKTKVSIMFLGSTLKEYCTVLNVACADKSRRMRTQSAVELSLATCAAPVCRKSTLLESVERPRSTSKSELNFGSFGIRASAAAISFCSLSEGVHTFRTLILTGGCPACCADADRPNANKGIRNLRDTAAFYQAKESRLGGQTFQIKIQKWQT